jgi:hypothetical protein
MTETDVNRIESLLTITLPSDYRQFLLAYPKDMPADSARHEIFESADAIIGHTEELRAGLLPETSWPDDMLVIGDSGCGDFYCLDLSEEPPSVVCWNHETGEFEFTASSINQWYRKVRANHSAEAC